MTNMERGVITEKAVLACFLVLVLVLGGAFGQQVQIPREEALYVAGFQWVLLPPIILLPGVP